MLLNTGGVLTDKEEGRININIYELNHKLFITISNNLIEDEQKSDKKKEKHTSRGIEITKQRLMLHGKITKQPAKFDFKEENNMVSVTFEMPLITAKHN